MKICVTGGAGFIGSHVADAFLSKGASVTVVDDLSMGSEENISSQCRFVNMNICSDEFDSFMDSEAFDVVSHHAAHTELRISVEQPLHDASVNILGSLRLLEACKRNAVNHVVLASTGGAIYGEQQQFPASEDHPTTPVAPYGVAKLAMEHYANYYRAVHELRVTCLRYTNVYGPRQNPNGEAGAIAIFLNKWLNGQTAIVYGDGQQTRDYIHVRDVAASNVVAVENRLNGTYNVATGVETSLNEVITKMSTSLSTPSPVEHVAGKPGDIRRSVCTSYKIHQATGWIPEFDLENGLADTIKWFVGKNLRQ